MKRYFLNGFSLLMVIFFLVSFNGVLIVEHICLTCQTDETSIFFPNHHHHCCSDSEDHCDHHQSDNNDNCSVTECSVKNCCYQDASFLQVLPLVTNSDDNTKALIAPDFIIVFLSKFPETADGISQNTFFRLEPDLKIRATFPTYDFCQCLL